MVKMLCPDDYYVVSFSKKQKCWDVDTFRNYIFNSMYWLEKFQKQYDFAMVGGLFENISDAHNSIDKIRESLDVKLEGWR